MGADISKYVWPSTEYLLDYDHLWTHLEKHALLKDKEYPAKSPKEAWESALSKSFKVGNKGVSLSASFSYDHGSSNGPLFRFKLEPLKVEMTHRFGRRFGNDRFLEISMPSITSSNAPPILKSAGEGGCRLVTEWLINGTHDFLGRIWQPFCVKDGRSKKPILKRSILDEVEKTPMTQKIFFFAVRGREFEAKRQLPKKDEPIDEHIELTIEGLINWMIPLKDNDKQPIFKLFSRISLGEESATYRCYYTYD